MTIMVCLVFGSLALGAKVVSGQVNQGAADLRGGQSEETSHAVGLDG